MHRSSSTYITDDLNPYLFPFSSLSLSSLSFLFPSAPGTLDSDSPTSIPSLPLIASKGPGLTTLTYCIRSAMRGLQKVSGDGITLGRRDERVSYMNSDCETAVGEGHRY